MSDLGEKIRKLAREKNALILAHNYQPGEIQDVADHVGDSLELARLAADNQASMILFCGVHFMAESAAILAPDKKVILPVLNAGCPMADMATIEKVREIKSRYPGSAVVTYINSSAIVKAESDIICTSGNAVKIVNQFPADEIIFVPDKNLGAWVKEHTDKKIHLFDGFCPCHNRFSLRQLDLAKQRNPRAVTIAHPECSPEIARAADHVLSTGEMVSFARTLKPGDEVIVITEEGMIHHLRKENPRACFIPGSDDLICEDMKRISRHDLLDALIHERHVITVDAALAGKARIALDAMLRYS